jgi:putative sigma-54 modulation protein
MQWRNYRIGDAWARAEHGRRSGAARLLRRAANDPDREAASPPLLMSSDPFHERICMNLTISGHHLEVTPALREYVTAKLERITRHFDQVVDITVILSVEKLSEKERRQKAEVTLHVKGKDLFAECAAEDLYAAIDQLMDKLDRQVVRHKDKVQDHHHESAKRIDATLN